MGVWLLLACFAVAQAPVDAPAVAFRVVPPTDGYAFTSRLALVPDRDGPFITELTLRADGGWRWVGLSAELAGTAARSPEWSSSGLGNLVVEARFRFGDSSLSNGLGVRGTLSLADRSFARGPVAWWGTVPEATLPFDGIAVVADGMGGRWAYHAHFGGQADPFQMAGILSALDLGLGVATVQPLAPGWNVVAEAEWAANGIHFRSLVRRGLWDDGTLDAGVAVAIPALFTDPNVQFLMAVRAGATPPR